MRGRWLLVAGCALCQKQTGCGGWTWGDTVVHGACFLRKPNTHWRHQPGAWSGPASGPPAPPAPPPPPPPTVSVSPVFSSDMVLQRDTASVIWGWTATAGAPVTVSLGHKRYQAQSTGNLWKATLDPQPASSGPGVSLNVSSGADTVVLERVLFGDVYLCSGQSNMECARPPPPPLVHKAFTEDRTAFCFAQVHDVRGFQRVRRGREGRRLHLQAHPALPVPRPQARLARVAAGASDAVEPRQPRQRREVQRGKLSRHSYRCHLGCILLKIAAISSPTGLLVRRA